MPWLLSHPQDSLELLPMGGAEALEVQPLTRAHRKSCGKSEWPGGHRHTSHYFLLVTVGPVEN